MSNTTFLETEERKIYSGSKKHYVPAKEIEVKTAPMKLTIGIESDCMPMPRPDLAGLRLTPLTGGKIYLVNPEGFLQYIPDPTTYNNLFRNWDNILQEDLIDIAMGDPITEDAVLAQNESGAVYFVSNGVKRWITGPSVMDKYNFNWNTVVVPPHVLVDFIPTGSSWS